MNIFFFEERSAHRDLHYPLRRQRQMCIRDRYTTTRMIQTIPPSWSSVDEPELRSADREYSEKREGVFLHRSTDGKWRKPRILITGCLGQIGTELVEVLRTKYGPRNVIASDVRRPPREFDISGPYAFVDVTDIDDIQRVVVEHNATWVVHNASILSATGEQNPQLALQINAKGCENMFEVARKHNLRLYIPSSIAAFGPDTPKHDTPDDTILRPTTMYGITKVHSELMGEYYQQKFGVDFRALRYPGIISSEALPGGGTTDWAVDVFYQALTHGEYTCFVSEDTEMPMMFMPDCIRCTQEMLEVERTELKRSVYNVTGCSFSPKQIAESIRRHIPGFKIHYDPDFRQAIADSWPKSIDDSNARKDWGWDHEFDLDAMVDEMLVALRKKLGEEAKF
eukprot:TRINITY_DN19820_c0_g1_i2.p1 TRINITY_DN19820_c0_g1~~TRINITY_DN19820_c0_g1_i2.p1  ORF type:complete len:396 (-),score=83.11 TRINITY_DN19820_c0_g1_i2:66-1253(-)